jgi:hypothetical protein|tara:strand:- start:2813 stop:4282 length:1470 start_codon:yes stop_codon:yes gene_type:complete
MTIKINGTNTTAQPSITGTDTDTGLVYGDNEVKIVTEGTEKFKVTNGNFDFTLRTDDDRVKFTNQSGDEINLAPGRGKDDWSRHVFNYYRSSWQNGSNVYGTNVYLSSITGAGNYYALGSLSAGRSVTDANSPSSFYNDQEGIGLNIYKGIADNSDYQARVILRTWTGDDDDRACFYYLDSNSNTTAVDYDQDQRLKMTGSGRIQGRHQFWSGRVESDEATPNSVYVGGTFNGYFSYYGSGFSTYIRGRNTDNADAVFLADTGGGVVIKFESDGDGRFDGGADVGAASDYAEFFEWEDANPSNEDRRGLSVVVGTDGKIREAIASDATSDIIGIVSALPAVVGDSAYLNWQGRHLKDEWGSWVKVDQEFLVWNKKGTYTNEAGEKVEILQPDITDPQCEPDHQVLVSEIAQTPDIPQYAIDNNLRITKKARVTNPDFDPNIIYTPRVDRPEWDAIGLMGKLWLKPGQIAGDRWIKLKDGNNGLTYWLVR